jgi:hypothetical protein
MGGRRKSIQVKIMKKIIVVRIEAAPARAFDFYRDGLLPPPHHTQRVTTKSVYGQVKTTTACYDRVFWTLKAVVNACRANLLLFGCPEARRHQIGISNIDFFT